MKIFRCDQIIEIDEYTIRNEPVASADLMERAAGKLFEWYSERFEITRPVVIFAGTGNNGGDGLALARMLARTKYKTTVCFVGSSDNSSADWKINRRRLNDETQVPLTNIDEITKFPALSDDTIIIDALFGSGLTRPVSGITAEVIRKINASGCIVISIDIPSGLFGEDNSNNSAENIITAEYTLTFQFPKLSFMFPENEKHLGKWIVLPIGLDAGIIESTPTPFQLLDKEE
jgi:hydroxyethylthiazole kinase-like uncharacterized protein yjeF